VKKITTTYEKPPIPCRSKDWSASREDWDLGDQIGYGKSDHDAIEDLKEKEALANEI